MDYIVEIMNKGFLEVQAKNILNKLEYYNINKEIFLKKYDDCYKEFHDLNFTDKQIKYFFIMEPRIIYCKDKIKKRLKNAKNKVLYGDNKFDEKSIPKVIIFLEETVNDKYKFLRSLKFSKSQIKEMVKRDPKIMTRSKQSINNCIKILKKLNLNETQITKIFVRNSKDILVNSKFLKDKIDYVLSFGFTKDECGIMIYHVPKVIFDYIDNFEYVFRLFNKIGLSKEEIITSLVKYTKIIKANKEVYEDIRLFLKNKDFTEKEIDKLTVGAKEIITYNENNLNEFYDIFYNNDLSDEDIKKILLGNPKIMYHSLNKIIDIINCFKKFDIPLKDINIILINYPRIFESSIENLEEKLKLLLTFDLFDYVLLNPKNMIQGCEKTFLRYLYAFNILEEEINETNCNKLIFSSCPKEHINYLRSLFSYKNYKDNELSLRLENSKNNNVKIKCYH